MILYVGTMFFGLIYITIWKKKEAVNVKTIVAYALITIGLCILFKTGFWYGIPCVVTGVLFGYGLEYLGNIRLRRIRSGKWSNKTSKIWSGNVWRRRSSSSSKSFHRNNGGGSLNGTFGGGKSSGGGGSSSW